MFDIGREGEIKKVENACLTPQYNNYIELVLILKKMNSLFYVNHRIRLR